MPELSNCRFVDSLYVLVMLTDFSVCNFNTDTSVMNEISGVGISEETRKGV